MAMERPAAGVVMGMETPVVAVGVAVPPLMMPATAPMVPGVAEMTVAPPMMAVMVPMMIHL